MASNDSTPVSTNGRGGRPGPHRRDSSSVLDYALTRGRRLTPTRKRLAEIARTLAWVAPLSVLIWIYAEREQVLRPNSPNVIGVPIHFISSDPANLSVECVDGPQAKVNLKISGPQEALDRVRNELTAQSAAGLPIRIRPDSVTAGLHQPINVREKIVDDSVFRTAGVAVEEVQPAQLFVDVEPVKHRTVEVQIPPDVAASYPSTQLLPPPTVDVWGPEQQIRNGPFKVYANVAGLVELKQPGTHVLPSVQLVLPAGEEKLHLAVAALPLTLVVRDSDVTETISSIQVVVRAPPSKLKTYDVGFDDSVKNIRMTGPPAVIAGIQHGTIHVQAVLDIQPEDEVNATPHRTLKFEVPDGVHVNAEDEAKQYDFTLTKR